MEQSPSFRYCDATLIPKPYLCLFTTFVVVFVLSCLPLVNNLLGTPGFMNENFKKNYNNNIIIRYDIKRHVTLVQLDTAVFSSCMCKVQLCNFNIL